VKHFLNLQLLLPLFFFLPAKAQNENWDTYMAKFGDKPGSVLVDVGLMEVAPDKRYPFLVITGPKGQKCNDKGLPDKETIDELEEILNATDNFLTGVTPKVLAGTFTYNCERLNYYYVKDTNNIRNAIMRMYNRNYANYSYALNMKYDPEWDAYRTFLYPSDETITWMENDKLITKMMQAGDDLTKQRDINFQLYFRTDSDRNACSDFAVAKGYRVAKKIVPAKETHAPFELIASKYGFVKIEAIDTMMDELRKEAKKHHGFYDGWDAKQ
jgi:uncharacterized protein DUF695/regulator of ribonuclease activity B